MDASGESYLLRIGELSRRLGVSDHVLRAWESRYGLLQPVRSTGGFRLYSEADAGRVRRMQARLELGLSAAEAARAVLDEDAAPVARPAAPTESPEITAELSDLTGLLRHALESFDEPAAQAILDRLMSELSTTAVLRDVVVPYLTGLGDRWERGAVSIAQEHFASQVLRGRLAGLARGWGGGHGPRAVLACPPGELHDLGLMIFGIALRHRGWRIAYLGSDTPLEELTRAVEATGPDLVVLAATVPGSLEPHVGQLTALARRAPLVLAGAGATPQLADTARAGLLTRDPVTAADLVGWPQS
jgi:MerR family transcriptional regulator, light-induced transcriptional regulator